MMFVNINRLILKNSSSVRSISHWRNGLKHMSSARTISDLDAFEAPKKPGYVKMAKIYLRIRYIDWLKDCWYHTKDSSLVFLFGCSVFYVDVYKAYQLPSEFLYNRRRLSKNDKQLIKFGIVQILKFIPFFILLLIPFGEFCIPLILKFVPSFLPYGFDTFGNPIDVAIGRKFSYSVGVMNNIINEKLNLMTKDLKLKELLSKQISSKDKTAYESATISDLMDYLPFFDLDHFMKTAPTRDILLLCKLMGLSTEGFRKEIIDRIISKAHRIKCEDYTLYDRLDEGLDHLQHDRLLHLCLDRGINCIGHDREKLIKRLSRWIENCVESQLPVVFMFLTRVSHYDKHDYVGEISERTNEITRGFSVLLTSLKTTINEKASKSNNPQMMLYMRVKILTTDPTEKPSKFIT